MSTGDAALAYSTSTGERPRTRLARLAAEREGVHEAVSLIRKTTSANHPWRVTGASSEVQSTQVPAEVLSRVRPGERLVMISPTEFTTVYRR